MYACSILPEHVHLVVGRHHYDVEQVVRVMKQSATEELTKDRRHPLAVYRDREGKLPMPWARKCWHVFLEDDADVARAVTYVERHPMKEGLRGSGGIVWFRGEASIFDRRLNGRLVGGTVYDSGGSRNCL